MFFNESSKRPLQCQSWIDEERLAVIGVVDEVVADFHLGANAQICVLQSPETVEVVPELRLSEKHQLSVTTGILATPEIDEA